MDNCRSVASSFFIGVSIDEKNMHGGGFLSLSFSNGNTVFVDV